MLHRKVDNEPQKSRQAKRQLGNQRRHEEGNKLAGQIYGENKQAKKEADKGETGTGKKYEYYKKRRGFEGGKGLCLTCCTI